MSVSNLNKVGLEGRCKVLLPGTAQFQPMVCRAEFMGTDVCKNVDGMNSAIWFLRIQLFNVAQILDETSESVTLLQSTAVGNLSCVDLAHLSLVLIALVESLLKVLPQ